MITINLSSQGIALSVCSFLCLPKETNQRKGTRCPLSRRGRDALRSSMLPGLCKLASLKQCKALFRQPLRCSAAGQWDFDCMGIKNLTEITS
ncbi:MAG: hypothetical protein A2512_09270 [Deltaproteobacteria bacterium RIFOXYD12_FULL_56_24]|nr:MAG: hypothetical protein A2512_09270 [Deltaproteobacteria bacterium RIFOXYD12_FULL_56_24]